jgi:hypothetical protein
VTREQATLFAGALAVAALGVAAAFVLGGPGPADASTLSRAAGGWLGARRYLEERGTEVQLLDRSPVDERVRGTLVFAFPWQRYALGDIPGVARRHLDRGGDLVFAYVDTLDPIQDELAESLGLVWETRRPRPPLRPFPWKAYVNEEWTLTPPDGSGRPARVRAFRRAPGAPRLAQVLLQDSEGRAVAFLFTRGRGRVAVLPSELFANNRLSVPGNADVLERLRGELGDRWVVDEFHHGLVAADAAGDGQGPRVLAYYVMQVAFVYALCALAVARRFGPAWREPLVSTGSAAGFLVGLGALHHRLGHHVQASRALVARARELSPHLGMPEEPAYDGPALVALARKVGIRQSAGGRKA